MLDVHVPRVVLDTNIWWPGRGVGAEHLSQCCVILQTGVSFGFGQAAYELAVAERSIGERIAAEVTPDAA